MIQIYKIIADLQQKTHPDAMKSKVSCRRRLKARPNVPFGDEFGHYLGHGRGVARVTKEEEKQRIFPIGQ